MAMFETPLGPLPSLSGSSAASKKKRPGDISDVMAGLGLPGGAAPLGAAPKLMHSPAMPGLPQPETSAPLTAFGAGEATRGAIGATAAAGVAAGKAVAGPNLDFLKRAGEFGRGLFGASPAGASPMGAAQAARAPAAPSAGPRPVIFDPAAPGNFNIAPPSAGATPTRNPESPAPSAGRAADPIIGNVNGRPITRSQAETAAARLPISQPGWPALGAPNGGVVYTPANSGGATAGGGPAAAGGLPLPTSTNAPAATDIPRPVASAPVGGDFRSNLPGQDAGGGLGGGGLGGGGMSGGTGGGAPQADTYKIRLATEKADKARGQIEDAAWRAGLRAKHMSSGGSAQHAQANLIGTLAQFGAKQLDTEVGIATGDRDAKGKAALTAAEQAGATQRTGMQDSGETRRTEIKEAGATARANIANIARPVGAVTPAMQFEQDNKTYQTLLANPPMPGDSAGAASHQQQLAALQAKLAGYMSMPSPPAIATNEQTGQRISFNPQTQQWEPI